MTRGNAPYDPRMLVTVPLYAYAVGIPASRQIAREWEENVAFRVLVANQRLDFRTLSDFRKHHLPALAKLFVDVLKLCRQAGLVKLGHIASDGTKIRANASKHKPMSDGRMVTEEARLQAEVAALLQQAEAADARDDARDVPDRHGDELPAQLAWREQRLESIRTAKMVLEQEAQAEAALTQAAQDAQPPARSRRDRPPSPPKTVPPPDVTNEPNDKQQAQPLMTAVLAQTGQVPRVPNLDAGYFSEANVEAIATLGCEPMTPPDRQAHGRTTPAAPRGRPSAGLSMADRMRLTLRTARGRRRYGQRKAIVEPVFDQIKQGRGFRQFLLRGEWALICTTHNMLKLWTAWRRRRRPACRSAGKRPGERLRGRRGIC